jgi:hypothetical protein
MAFTLEMETSSNYFNIIPIQNLGGSALRLSHVVFISSVLLP